MDVIAVPTAKVETSLWSTASKHLLATCVCLILMFAAIFAAFRLIVTRRLQAITRHFQMAAVQADDSLVPISAEGQDEIGILVNSYNSLVDRLRSVHGQLESRVQERTDELSQANEALQAEIAERERLEREVHQIGAREQRASGRSCTTVLVRS